jgi:uncharacterized membrane protein
VQEHTLPFFKKNTTVKKVFSFIIFFALTVVVLQSCEKETSKPEPNPVQEPPCQPTYTSDIKAIVNAKCAIPGCHDGNSGLVNFTTYGPLKEKVDNGRVKRYVFELKIMPPATATQLTEDEKKLLQCWLDNGASEN